MSRKVTLMLANTGLGFPLPLLSMEAWNPTGYSSRYTFASNIEPFSSLPADINIIVLFKEFRLGPFRVHIYSPAFVLPGKLKFEVSGCLQASIMNY